MITTINCVGSSDITLDWISQFITTTVRLNEQRKEQCSIPLKEPSELPALQTTFSHEDLEICIRKTNNGATNISGKIFSILTNGNFRKGSLEKLQPFNGPLLQAVETAVHKNEPVQIVLPSLPFKNLCPLSCGRPADAIDLGEWLLCAQLRDICRSIEQVYEPGARITVLCDGIVYADIFGSDNILLITGYKKSCGQIIHALGATDCIKLVDMSTLTNAWEPEFSSKRGQIEYLLTAVAQSNLTVKQHLTALQRGMLFNLPWPNVSWETLSLCSMNDQVFWPIEIREATWEGALHYASFLLAAHYFQIISQAFPHAIRGTVHPKPAAQLPLHLVNNHTVVFPYNGLPVASLKNLRTTGSIRRAATIKRRYELFQESSVKAVIVEGYTLPFFYVV